jgi:hypothetical protein
MVRILRTMPLHEMNWFHSVKSILTLKLYAACIETTQLHESVAATRSAADLPKELDI